MSFSTGIDYSSGRYTEPQSTDMVVGLSDIALTTAINSSLSDAQQLFASGSRLFHDSLSFTIYAETGLTPGAPSVGTGLLIGWKAPM